jgi:hypothetical protein
MRDITVEPWGAVESLLLAAGGRAEGLAATIRRIGLERVTDVVVDELIVRCDVPAALDTSVVLQLELSDGSALAGRGLTIDRTGMSVVPGWVDGAVATVRFDAVDAVENLFSPSGRPHQASRDVTCSQSFLKEMSDGFTAKQAGPHHWVWRRQQLSAAVHAVITACSARPSDLGELSVRFGSDKWVLYHWYTQHYEQHFARFRLEPVRLLEIGIGGYQFADRGGESLRMWQRYFHRGLVYGLDIFDKPGVTGPRIRTIQGDQNDPELLAELGRRFGPFDIVIDDGSHVNEHVKTSFRCLFPFVRPGGLYVVEDCQTAYWPGYGGDDRDLINADTSIGMLKRLVDGLNHQEILSGAEDPPSYTDRNVVGMCFYHGLAIVEKGVNTEERAPSFISGLKYSGGAVEVSA